MSHGKETNIKNNEKQGFLYQLYILKKIVLMYKFKVKNMPILLKNAAFALVSHFLRISFNYIIAVITAIKAVIKHKLSHAVSHENEY